MLEVLQADLAALTMHGSVLGERVRDGLIKGALQLVSDLSQDIDAAIEAAREA